MASNFPTALDVFPPLGAVPILSAHQNDRGDAIENAQAKIGIDGSLVTTSLDYIIKNAASIDPGHKHTLGGLSFSGLTAGHALFASSATAVGFRAIVESDIVDGAILARVNATETISGAWTFNGTRPKFKQGIELQGAGSESVTLAAAAGAGTVVYTLPSSFTAGQYLQVTAGGVCVWATVSGGGGGGWTDDGTVVRLATAGDQVSIGSASPPATARLYVEAQGASDIPLIIKHAASPTGAYTEWRNSAGTPIATVTAAGGFYSKTTATAAGGLIGAAGVILGATAGQWFGVNIDSEANLFTAAHLALKIFGPTLNALFGDLAAATTDIAAQLGVVSASASKVAARIRAAASPSANILEVQDNTGAATYLAVGPAGTLSTRAIATQAGFGITLAGATSGSTLIKAPASGGTVTYTLPPNDGVAGQVISTDGTGVLSWVNGSGASSLALSNISAAGAANSINNGTFGQIWAWALGATGNTALTITENVAASSTSTLVKARTITGSTSVAMEVGAADAVTGTALYVNGGRTTLKTRYIRMGSTAGHASVYGAASGAGGFDSMISFEGDIEPPTLANYPADERRMTGFNTVDYIYRVPHVPNSVHLYEALVYFGLHCNYNWMDPARDITTASAKNVAAHDVYAIDETIEGNLDSALRTIILHATEINYNSSRFRATTGEINFMSGTNLLNLADAGDPHNFIHFFIRQNGSKDPTNFNFGMDTNANVWSRMTGIQTMKTGSSFTTERQWRPFFITGYTGRSYHAPRFQIGGEQYNRTSGLGLPSADKGYFITGCNTTGDLGGASTTPLPAALTVVGFRTDPSDTTDHHARLDKYLYVGLDYDFWNAATSPAVPRSAFYTQGGMRLWAHSTPVEAVLGAIYVDSDDSKLWFHNGSTWVDLTGGGGGGGGWTDDGTVVRLTTATDQVIIGAATTALPGRLTVIGTSGAGDKSNLIVQRYAAQSSPMIAAYSDDGTTILWQMNNSGAIFQNAYHLWRHTDSVTKALLAPYSDGCKLLLGGDASLDCGASARNYIAIKSSVVPSTPPADVACLYVKDAAAGNAWPCFKPEDGVERFILGVESVNTSQSSGVLTIKLTGSTSKDNTGFMKVHDHTGTARYIPYVTNPN